MTDLFGIVCKELDQAPKMGKKKKWAKHMATLADKLVFLIAYTIVTGCRGDKKSMDMILDSTTQQIYEYTAYIHKEMFNDT